jgi:hypothetical protein
MRYVVCSRWTVLVWAALGACGGEPSALKPAEAPALAARAPVDRRTVAQGRVEEIGSLAVGDRLRGLDAPLVCGPFGWPAATGFACDCVPVYYDSGSEVGAPRGAKPTMTRGTYPIACTPPSAVGRTGPATTAMSGPAPAPPVASVPGVWTAGSEAPRAPTACRCAARCR